MRKGRPKSTEETKTQRLNLLVKPSTYDKIYKITYMRQDSINNIVNEFLEEYIKNNAGEIERYDSVFGNNDKEQSR